MALLLFLSYVFFTLVVLYRALPSPAWEIGSFVYLLLAIVLVTPKFLTLVMLIIIVMLLMVIHVQSIRQMIADFLYRHAEKSIPKLSKTEAQALHAGDTWLEEDIFTGRPDWQRLAAVSSSLSTEEQLFLDNETKILCNMLDEWTISQAQDLPELVWSYMKSQGFFGLVIDKKFGGLGFSARAHSEIVMKIASRSSVAAVTVMVPNSLGPGELLHFYGTNEQKENYLPRLANGTEIPCFALTEPYAGSDATSIQSEAIVTEREVKGQLVLGLVINHLNKRWITLAPVATLIGLAVNLKDPDKLLQGNGCEGITCILISRDTENLQIGNRHLPASQPFMNGTIRGNDIFVPITSIIGGQKNAGAGWQMLVECLSIGRSISLPALGAASSSMAYLVSSAFVRVRKQFNVEIAQFEGIEEKLAEVAGLNYLINATRLLTVDAVNQHKKPSVASAITKYFNTELARIVINNAMDIHAGRGVVVGPRNYLMNYYQGIPISITVEGANIMSRNLLIFGQGSMACHPFIRKEIDAINKKNKTLFGQLLWQHINYFFHNFAKTWVSALTGGLLISTPKSLLKRQYQCLTRLTYAFAWIADLSLIFLGKELKRKERLSARLADSLSYLYMAMAVLRYCQQHNEQLDHKIHAQWALSYCFYHAQRAMITFCNNFPSRIIGKLISFVAFPFGQTMRYPDDKLDKKLAHIAVTNNDYRNNLKKILYVSDNPKDAVATIEHAFQLIIEHGHLYEKITEIKRCSVAMFKETLEKKVALGQLTQIEMAQLIAVEHARWDAMQVDEFTQASMINKSFNSVTDTFLNPLD